MTASAAAFAALIDDETTTLPFKRTAGSPADLAALRTRPWWAIDQAGRELLAKGVPVVWRRAAVQSQGSRVYDGAVFRARSKEDMRRFDDIAARIAAAAPADRIGPAIPVPDLPLVYPADPDAPPAIGWTNVREFVAVMARWWWPGWSVRRAISGEVPGPDECAWSCRLHAEGRVHDLTLIASMP